MTPKDACEVLAQRRDYLTERIAAKERVGWDREWDTRERDALACVIEELRPAAELPAPQRCAACGHDREHHLFADCYVTGCNCQRFTTDHDASREAMDVGHP